MASAVLSLPIPFLFPRRLMFCSITISSGKCRGKYVSICDRILFRKNKPFRENGACWVIRITNSASVSCEWKFSLLLLFHAPILTLWSKSISLNCLEIFWVRQIKKFKENNHLVENQAKGASASADGSRDWHFIVCSLSTRVNIAVNHVFLLT